MKKILFLIYIILFSVVEADEQSKNKTQFVSFIELIANPEKYHNKKVKVIGYINVEFELDSLWFSKEHLENKVYPNCLWLNLDSKKTNFSKDELNKMTKKYVILIGTLDSNSKGHMDMYTASLNVSRISLWNVKN